MMESGRKKRKMGNDQEDEEEEEKVEKFFALIRSTREMRDRLRNGSEDIEKKKLEEEKKAVWNPTFQPEDFMDQEYSKSKNIIIPDLKQGAENANGDIAGPSSNREEEEKETKKEDSGLDLKLSL